MRDRVSYIRRSIAYVCLFTCFWFLASHLHPSILQKILDADNAVGFKGIDFELTASISDITSESPFPEAHWVSSILRFVSGMPYGQLKTFHFEYVLFAIIVLALLVLRCVTFMPDGTVSDGMHPCKTSKCSAVWLNKIRMHPLLPFSL